MSRKNIFLFPETDNFQEERPHINYENIYGWIDAYCMLFDPRNLLLLGKVPVPANGPNTVSADDFIITADKIATDELAHKFPLNTISGIFIRPEFKGRAFCSYKERIETPVGNLYYPGGRSGLGYDVAKSGIPVPGWKIGDFCALHREQNHLAVRLELFSLFWRLADELPEERYAIGSRLLNELIKTAGLESQDYEGEKSAVLDFMAYGLNRFLIWRLAEQKNTEVEFPDSLIMAAAAAWSKGENVVGKLQQAFSRLSEIRHELSQTEFLFYEAPHFGVFLDGQPFIEVEWPQNLVDRMRGFLKLAHEYGWRPSLEGSANCWSYLLEKAPELRRDLVRAWDAGEIDLVNGTYALPFALFSPLGMQYREFQLGAERFKELFGRPAKTYECQENSFSPQMPELLKMFGYEQAVHVTQNHGSTPPAERNFLWKSPSGVTIPAIGCGNRRHARISIQIYYNLPELAADSSGEQILFNMQDITTIPMRLLMIRSMKYASIWGRFVTADDLKQPSETSHVYSHDDYQLSQSYFYIKPNRDNMLSSHEKIFRFNDAYRCAQLLEPDFQDQDFERDLCMLESHDVLVAAGERPGEFYLNFAEVAPPFIQRTVIDDKVRAVIARCESKIAVRFPENAELWNLSGCRLPFVRQGEDRIPVSVEPWSRIRLPETLPAWTISKECGSSGDTFVLNHGLECRNFDSRGYQWQLISRMLETRSNLFRERIILFHAGESIEISMVYSETRDFFEISVRYAVNGFECKERKNLDEYLSLEFVFADDSPLGPVRVFAPNVENETDQDDICSPYYLRLQKRNCLFLNQGAFFYKLQREKSKIQWIYHVPLENVHTRSMVVSFRSETPLEQARGWAHSIVHGTPAAPEQWPVEEYLSIEGRTENGKWLVSNLSDKPVRNIPPWGIAEI